MLRAQILALPAQQHSRLIRSEDTLETFFIARGAPGSAATILPDEDLVALTADLAAYMVNPLIRLESEGPPGTALSAAGTLTFTLNPTAGTLVSIGGVSYLFAVTPALAYQVEIGVDLATSIANLEDLINNGDGFGAVAHPSVTSVAGATTLVATAAAAGAEGNAITTTTDVGGASWGAATLEGGSSVLAGARVGQFCRYGDAAPYIWFAWDGVVWDDIADIETTLIYLEANAAAARDAIDVVRDIYTALTKTITSDTPAADEPADYLCRYIRLSSPWTGSIPTGYALPTLANMAGRPPVTYFNGTGGALSIYDPGDLITPLFTLSNGTYVRIWNIGGVWRWELSVEEAGILETTVGAQAKVDTAVPPVYNKGTHSGGDLTIDFTDSSRQYVQLTGNMNLIITGGSVFDELTLVVHKTSASHTVTFDAAIKLTDEATLAVPFVLEANKCYEFHFRHMGGGWCFTRLEGAFTSTI